jgi:hypothetical protein
MLRLDMSDANGENYPGPVANEPFARSISWRVFNEHIFPKHLGGVTVIADGVATGDVSYVVPESESLTLNAIINGRERFEDLGVTRAVLGAVSPSRTFQTSAGKYVARLVLWGLLWVAAFGLAWPALNALAIWVFIVLFAAACVAPPFLSSAIIDFVWWSGHGFRNESRARWILAAVLWLLDACTLVLLQIRVA